MSTPAAADSAPAPQLGEEIFSDVPLDTSPAPAETLAVIDDYFKPQLVSDSTRRAAARASALRQAARADSPDELEPVSSTASGCGGVLGSSEAVTSAASGSGPTSFAPDAVLTFDGDEYEDAENVPPPPLEEPLPGKHSPSEHDGSGSDEGGEDEYRRAVRAEMRHKAPASSRTSGRATDSAQARAITERKVAHPTRTSPEEGADADSDEGTRPPPLPAHSSRSSLYLHNPNGAAGGAGGAGSGRPVSSRPPAAPRPDEATCPPDTVAQLREIFPDAPIGQVEKAVLFSKNTEEAIATLMNMLEFPPTSEVIDITAMGNDYVPLDSRASRRGRGRGGGSGYSSDGSDQAQSGAGRRDGYDDVGSDEDDDIPGLLSETYSPDWHSRTAPRAGGRARAGAAAGAGGAGEGEGLHDEGTELQSLVGAGAGAPANFGTSFDTPDRPTRPGSGTGGTGEPNMASVYTGLLDMGFDAEQSRRAAELFPHSMDLAVSHVFALCADNSVDDPDAAASGAGAGAASARAGGRVGAGVGAGAGASAGRWVDNPLCSVDVQLQDAEEGFVHKQLGRGVVHPTPAHSRVLPRERSMPVSTSQRLHSCIITRVGRKLQVNVYSAGINWGLKVEAFDRLVNKTTILELSDEEVKFRVRYDKQLQMQPAREARAAFIVSQLEGLNATAAGVELYLPVEEAIDGYDDLEEGEIAAEGAAAGWTATAAAAAAASDAAQTGAAASGAGVDAGAGPWPSSDNDADSESGGEGAVARLHSLSKATTSSSTSRPAAAGSKSAVGKVDEFGEVDELLDVEDLDAVTSSAGSGQRGGVSAGAWESAWEDGDENGASASTSSGAGSSRVAGVGGGAGGASAFARGRNLAKHGLSKPPLGSLPALPEGTSRSSSAFGNATASSFSAIGRHRTIVDTGYAKVEEVDSDDDLPGEAEYKPGFPLREGALGTKSNPFW